MWDENYNYPRIETGYVFTKDMNNELVKKLNTGYFNQGSAILKIKYYNPKDTIVQHLPVKERVNETEIHRMRNGYIVDTLPSVDIHEVFKNASKVIEIYEGVNYRKNFEVGLFEIVIDKLFSLRQK